MTNVSNLEAVPLKDSNKRVVKDPEKINIGNYIDTKKPTNKSGLYSDGYSSDTGRFLYPTGDKHFAFQNEGGVYYAKKKGRTNP